MRKDELLEALEKRKNGTLISIIVRQNKTKSLNKSARDDGNELIKISRVVIRKGIDVKNLSSYKEYYGDRTPGALPWGEWEVPGLLVSHKGNSYLRCYSSTIPNKSVYYLNGETVTWEELCNSGMLLESAKSHKDGPGILMYNINDIVSIKKAGA